MEAQPQADEVGAARGAPAAAVDERGLVPVQRRIIEWGPDGLPTLTAKPVLTKHHLQSLYYVAAAQPFICDDPFNPDFGKYAGMTLAEVMVRKQLEGAAKSGDAGLIETVMDRLMGKPERTEKQLKVTASYEDYLKQVASAEGGATPIDAEVIDSAAAEREIFGDLL